MNRIGQGFLRISESMHALMHGLSLVTLLLLSSSAYATENTVQTSTPQSKRVFIIYSTESSLQSTIFQKLSDILNVDHPDIIVSKLSPDISSSAVDQRSDLIIGIGPDGILSANRFYATADKLFIATDQRSFKPDSGINKDDAVLYMTQSYCRQFSFIDSISRQFEVIGILYSEDKPVEIDGLRQCANEHGKQIHAVKLTDDDNPTTDIKNVLKDSDVLLALPDKNIYNHNTVKNILMTSYRYRKPVIAFSKNFVYAGALAAVYSNTEQIAETASTIIEGYFKNDHLFQTEIQYPKDFEISLNKQVFRALSINIPEAELIRGVMEKQTVPQQGGQ